MEVNLTTVIDMHLLYKTELLNGFNLIRVELKLRRKLKRACKSSWSRPGSQKVIYTDNSLEFGKACEDVAWDHCTSTTRLSETNAITERAVRRIEEGTSAILLRSGLDENGWVDSMECYCYLQSI